jgi:hypothetical protein
MGFDIADQLLIRFFFSICQLLGKNWEYSKTVHKLFTDLKKACDSARREVLHSILIEFGTPLKLVTLIKMCLKL